MYRITSLETITRENIGDLDAKDVLAEGENGVENEALTFTLCVSIGSRLYSSQSVVFHVNLSAGQDRCIMHQVERDAR